MAAFTCRYTDLVGHPNRRANSLREKPRLRGLRLRGGTHGDVRWRPGTPGPGGLGHERYVGPFTGPDADMEPNRPRRTVACSLRWVQRDLRPRAPAHGHDRRGTKRVRRLRAR